LLPIEGEAGEGSECIQLIVFARDGWLESLELVYHSEAPPSSLPDPATWQQRPRASPSA
jgi:hypothetical protein